MATQRRYPLCGAWKNGQEPQTEKGWTQKIEFQSQSQKAVYFFLAQREEVTCLMSHSIEVTEPGS